MNDLNKLFIPLKEAMELKVIGFNEPCLAWYDSFDDYELHTWRVADKMVCNKDVPSGITAPLFQQVFKWFREEHNLASRIDYDCFSGKKLASWNISGGKPDSTGSLLDWDSKEYKSYDEAEIECLRELIKLVKR
jgi:hypothetical protein